VAVRADVSCHDPFSTAKASAGRSGVEQGPMMRGVVAAHPAQHLFHPTPFSPNAFSPNSVGAVSGAGGGRDCPGGGRHAAGGGGGAGGGAAGHRRSERVRAVRCLSAAALSFGCMFAVGVWACLCVLSVLGRGVWACLCVLSVLGRAQLSTAAHRSAAAAVV
jgi:hypothetical protein